VTRVLLAAALAGALSACAGIPPLRLSKDPLTAAEHFTLGQSYEAQGLKKEAVAQYQASADKDEGAAGPWIAMGNIAFADGDLKRAEKCYRYALKALPHYAGAENNLAMVYLMQNRKYGDAEALAKDALDRDPRLKPYALDTLANLYLRQGRYPEAVTMSVQAEEAASASDDASLIGRILQTRRSIADAAREGPAKR
jgi:tetratricopeptide (TPR) repeat protein